MIDKFSVVTGEVDNAINIMKEVAMWGRSIGLKVWKDEQLTREKLISYAKIEDFCIGRVCDEDAGCMILQWYDPLFWPNASENEAGYIHKLCVRRAYAGIGIPGKMVEYAIEECKKRNIKFLRLDTGWTNEKLCNMYKSLGFTMVDKFMLGDSAFALFEMRID